MVFMKFNQNKMIEYSYVLITEEQIIYRKEKNI